MSTRVLTDLGEHGFSSGKEVDELLEKEAKERAKQWENPESVREAQERFQEEMVGSVQCCLKAN